MKDTVGIKDAQSNPNEYELGWLRYVLMWFKLLWPYIHLQISGRIHVEFLNPHHQKSQN